MKSRTLIVSLIISVAMNAVLPTKAIAEETVDPKAPTTTKAGECLHCRVDFHEHMVTSYAITYTSYQIYRKKLEMSPEAAMVASFGTGLLIGFARDKFVFNKPNEDVVNYMKANAAGAAVSAVFTIVVDF